MAVTKTILKKNKCRKSKWVSEYNLKISEKKREAKTREKGKDISCEYSVPKNRKAS